MTARMRTVAVVGTGDTVNEGSPLARRAMDAGRIIAELGHNLLTGAGGGVMRLAAQGFCQIQDRPGRSIGIVPGEVFGLTGNNLGSLSTLTSKPKKDYPNEWVEIPIFTHLPGKDPKGPDSRNVLNVASADVIVVLAGGNGTQAEFELGYGLGKPLIAFLGKGEAVGKYTLNQISTKKLAACVPDAAALQQMIKHYLP